MEGVQQNHRFVLSDGWEVRAVETVDELREQDLIDLEPAEYSRFENGFGFYYWSLSDADGNGQATVRLVGPLTRSPVEVIDVWVDERSDQDAVDAHVREWFKQLSCEGHSLVLVAEDLPYEVDTVRELTHLHDQFVSAPARWLGGADARWNLDCQPNAVPQLEWTTIAETALSELRSPWWYTTDRPEELYGRAWYTFAVLDPRFRAANIVNLLRDKLELDFDEKLEEMVFDQLYLEYGEALDELPLISEHEAYAGLREELVDSCRKVNLLERGFALVQYLDELLKLVPEEPEALREPLPGLIEARTRSDEIERAATWRPSTAPAGRRSGLAG